jgi:hypothetical protein
VAGNGKDTVGNAHSNEIPERAYFKLSYCTCPEMLVLLHSAPSNHPLPPQFHADLCPTKISIPLDLDSKLGLVK